jgi:hypothetical protein
MRHLPLLAALVIAAGCGGSSTTEATGNLNINNGTLLTNGTFSATINGTAWSAIGKVIVTRPTSTSIVLSTTSTTYGMILTLLNVTAPRIVALTTNVSDGSVATVANSGGMGWVTGKKVGTGTVTITTLTANHVAGTFTFDADGVTNTTATLQVRNGTFDVTF